MRWDGDTIVSEGLDKAAAEEARKKGLLSRVNRVLMPEGYILFYAYDPDRVGQPDALVALNLERYKPKDEREKSLGVAG